MSCQIMEKHNLIDYASLWIDNPWLSVHIIYNVVKLKRYTNSIKYHNVENHLI